MIAMATAIWMMTMLLLLGKVFSVLYCLPTYNLIWKKDNINTYTLIVFNNMSSAPLDFADPLIVDPNYIYRKYPVLYDYKTIGLGLYVL